MKGRYLLLLISLLLATVLLAGDRAGEEINWQVISGGGSIEGSSSSYRLVSTISETATGSGSSSSYILHHGFLQEFSEGPAVLCGDVNDDGVVNILDIIYYIDWKFKGGPTPVDIGTADVNSDGAYNILDIIYLIDFKFKGGPDPDCP